MLKELLPLLKKGDTLGLTIGCETAAGSDPVAEPARFRVNVMPKLFTLDGEKGADRKVLNTPLTITGTAEELDSAAFAETLTRFTTSATTARQTIDEVESAHKSGAAAAKAKPASSGVLPPHRPKTVAKPAAKPAHKSGAKPSSWKDRVKKALKPAPSKGGASVPASQPESTSAEPTAPVEAVAEPTAVEAPAPPAPPKTAAEATPALI